ncbi:hypothetical protein [Winogradskyella immobilis]|uniref:HEAT repeat domain-containing protein n=1 Tax=Winogradskyella immobilis TaxID=2816852 RepID=A0ABS8EQU5_9FLAO|nr:hypothetical protein [Winogradskyella immobilis]MCC1485590.1 hypothetical protein [Winogradskyella immobilis]MCG0017682.1 hypothetical protein [Winogradskyella immobilis]
MRKLLNIILTLTISLCFSQTKEQLLLSIIKVDRVDSNCIGFGCKKSKQYENFEKLKAIISEQELVELTNHNNSTVRTYASKALINSDPNFALKLLKNELDNNKTVRTFEGCIIDVQKTSSIIYHEYWNKIRIEAIRKTNVNNYEENLAMKKKLESDFVMEKLDSLIIHYVKEVDWILYNRVFENRKHKDSYLPRIEELAFIKNNACAFDYIKTHYSDQYSEKLEKYLTTDFPTAKFKKGNEVFYLHSFIKILLESKDEKYKKIAIDKLKANSVWKERSGWFKTTLRNHGIVL